MPKSKPQKIKYDDVSESEDSHMSEEETTYNSENESSSDIDTNDEYDEEESGNNKHDIEINDFKNKSYDDIRECMYKKINNKFAYAKLGKFNVIMLRKNGFINATKLCNSANKKLIHWMENKNSKEMIVAFSKLLNMDRDQIITRVNGGKNTIISGTYMHPDLIIQVASWCNNQFAFYVSKIVNDYLNTKACAEKDKLLKIKDDKIDKLNKKINTLRKEIKTVIDQNDDIYDQNMETHAKLDGACNERVPSIGKKKYDHMLVIIKNNDNNTDDSDETDDDENIKYNYHALRVMKKSYKNIISKHRKRFPNMEFVLRINYSPNSINLWNKIRERLGAGRKKKINIFGCKFALLDDYTIEELVEDIRKIHNERYDYD